jgi:hypothetical protein
VDQFGVSAGFIRFTHGGFSAPIIDPNDAAGLTEGRGINDSRVLCGDYTGSDGAFHGFFFAHNNYRDYSPPNNTFTLVLGINNVGDFCGSQIGTSGIQEGYISVGGVVTGFSVSGASATLAYQINSTNQFTGYYNDSSGVSHGYTGDSSGHLTFPIDPAGSTQTILFGNNDSNWIVGRYVDAGGLTHALLFVPPNRFTIFDFPGATFTSFNGINNAGFVVGRYTDPSSGFDHGIVCRISRGASSNAVHELPLKATPVVRPAAVNHDNSSLILRAPVQPAS